MKKQPLSRWLLFQSGEPLTGWQKAYDRLVAGRPHSAAERKYSVPLECTRDFLVEAYNVCKLSAWNTQPKISIRMQAHIKILIAIQKRR